MLVRQHLVNCMTLRDELLERHFVSGFVTISNDGLT